MMSGFWSVWVIVLVVLNWGLVTFLAIYATRVRIPTAEDGTTGHVWAHGAIREGVRQLPIWWMVMSAGFLIFAVFYLVLYPGFGSFAGTLGWSSASEVAQAQTRNAQRQAGLDERIRTQSIATLAEQADVVAAGRVLFGDNCAACHGAEGQGRQAVGAPSLTDKAWLYGRSDDAIHASIANGRTGVMPALGAALGERGVREVAAYVYELNGRDWPRDDLVAAGREKFRTSCVACHGPEGKGNQSLGAPDLTDDNWLYGDSLKTIMTTIRDGRNGHMPDWAGRLQERDIRLLTAWIRASGSQADRKAAERAKQ